MALTGFSVLLAEDNPTNQLVAVQMLESLGANVTLAVDGVEALEILDRERFDIGLIDIEMPRLSGLELIRIVRSGGGERAAMPLVALTAYVMREHTVAIENAGADGIIAKPILSIEAFGEDILGYIRRRSAAGGAASAGTDDADGPPVDPLIFDTLLETIGQEAKPEFLRRIMADVGNARDQIRMAHEAEDWGSLCAATHVLVSIGGSIGANQVHNLARCLNSAGHESDTTVIDRDVPAILREIDRMLEAVRNDA